MRSLFCANEHAMRYVCANRPTILKRIVMEYGYIRHSPSLPLNDNQLVNVDIPKEAIYIDNCSIKDDIRPARRRLMSTVQAGDLIYVQSLDRIARNVKDLLALLKELLSKGVSVHFVQEDLTISPNGNEVANSTILTTLDVLSIWERTLLRELQEEGKAAARLAGKHFGRPSSVTQEQRDKVVQLILEDNDKSVLQISRETGVPRTTCYRLKDMVKQKKQEFMQSMDEETREKESLVRKKLIEMINNKSEFLS